MDNIKVAIRVRPLIEKEKGLHLQSCWKIQDNTIFTSDSNGRQGTSYTFDHIFDEYETTLDIFEKLCVPIVDSAVQGFHGTIFAYGQSSSGKTFTMSGGSLQKGIIALSVDEIFNKMEMQIDRDFLMRVTYMEIYNEKVTDLLSSEEKSIKIHEDGDRNIQVVGLTESMATSSDDVYKAIQEGDKRRHMAETKQNDRSSRSHCILRMIIESRLKSDEEAVMVAHLNFVDLAGSEKAGENTGDRFREGCSINRSLFSLGVVISKLSNGEGHSHIGFRDSKLTRILQNALGGNSKTAIIATIAPAFLDESHSTLRFASRAKTIKNKPTQNEVLSESAMLKKYQREIRTLQDKLNTLNIIDVKIEKEDLEKRLYEKEEIQRKHEEMIANLQNIIVRRDLSHNGSKAAEKKKRRQTWCPGRKRPSSMRSMVEEEESKDKYKFLDEIPEITFSPPEKRQRSLDTMVLVSPELDAPTQQLMEIQDKYEALLKDHENLKKELSELDTFTALERESLEEQIEKQKEEIQNLYQVSDEALEEYGKMKKEYKRMQTERDVMCDEHCQMEHKYKIQSTRLQDYEKELEALRQDSNMQSKSDEKYSTSQEEVSSLKHTLEEKQSHIEALEKELEAMRTSEKELEAMRTSKKELQQENQALQENLHHLGQQAEDLKHQVRTLQEDKSRPGTEAEEQEGDGGRGKVDELEQEVQTLKEEKDLLGERLLEEENSHSDLKLAYEDVYNELQEFKDKSAKEEEYSLWKQTLAEKQSHIETLEKELEAMRTSDKELEAMRTSDKELEAVRTSEKELEAVRTSESSDSDKVTQLQQENQTLQENLHHVEQQAEDLKHQLMTLQEDKSRPCTEAEEQEGDGGRGKVDELEQEVQTLKEEKDLLGERLLEEENSHSDLKLAYEDVYNELQELKALSFKENENSLWKQTLEEKQSHIEALEKELEAMRTSEKELEAMRTEKELEAMRTESSDRDKVTQLQQENQTLQENLHHVEQQAEDLKHQLRTLQEDKSRPFTEAEEQEGYGGRGKVDELEQEVQTLKEEKDLLGERLLEEENSHSDLKLAYEDVYNELQELKALSFKEEEYLKCMQTLEEKQSHIVTLERELEAMRTSDKELEDMRTSEKELEAVRTSDSSDSDKVTQLQQENQTLQENLHHVEQQAEDLKHQLRTLQEDKSRPCTEAEEQEGDGGRGKVDELEQEVQTLKEEKDLLGERLLEEENSHSDLKLAYEDVYNELQEFKDKSAKNKEVSSLRQTLEEKQSHIEALEKELEAMRTSEKELEAMRTSEKELEAMRTSESSDSDKVTQLQQENQTLQENLHHVEQQAEDLKHQLMTLQEDKSRPYTEAEEQEVDGGRGKVDELEQEVQTLKEEKDLLGERLLEEENSHSDLKLAYEDVYNELQELKALSFKENENVLWKQTLEDKQSHIEALEKELEAMRTEKELEAVRTSEKELEAVRTSESSDRDKVTQLQQENQTLQENLHHLEQQAEDLKHQLRTLQEDKSRPCTEAEEQEGYGGRGKVDELEQEVQTLKEEKDLLGERLLEEENSHSDLKLAYEDVYNELEELKAQYSKERAVGMKMLQELKQQKTALEEQLNDKEVTTSFATVEKDLLEENMLLQDKVKELENMLSSGNMDSSLMALNNQLQEKLKLLESKTDIDQEEALEANMKLQGKIDELTQMLNEKENEEELMQENKHLQSRVIDLEKCSVECEELSENNRQLLKELEELRKCSVEKSKCLEEENTHLRRKIEELESEMSAAISNLKEVNDELLKKIEKYESANSVKLSESFEIDTNMKEKNFELENAVKDADNIREINLELEQKIMVFKDTILLKDEEINNLNSKLKESCGKNSTKSIEELIEENRCLKEQIEELEANSTLGSSEELVKENRTLQDRIAELESKVSLTGDHEQLYQQFNQIVEVMKEEHNNEMERIKQEWEGQVSEAEEKVKVAEEMVKVSEDITNSTQGKADNLRVKLQAAENEVKILEEKVQIAEEKLLAFEKEESSILSGVKAAEHKASAAEERLKEVEERLQGEVEKNTTEKEQMEAALDKNKQEIEHLLCKIKALEGEIERILLEKGTKDINEETIMTLEHEKSTLKMSIECLEKDKESLLEKINDLVCKTSNLENIVSDLNSQVKHLQDNERLMTAEKEDAEEKLCRLENKISSLENGKTEANLDLQKTESEKSEIIQEKIELSRKNSELMHERDEIAIKLKESIKNYATLEEESEKKCKYLEEERAKLLKTRDLLQEEILCMKKDLSSMKETLSNLSCVKTELEDLKTENGSLRETRQHNIQQVEELEAEKERLTALCSNLKQENTSLMHQCEKLEASATSTHQTQPSESDVLTLKEKLQKLEKELESTRDISARASRDCSLLHTKLISVKEENGKMKKELAKKNIEMTNLKERLSDAEENISKKSIQIRETEDMYDHRIRKLQLQLRQQEAADSTFIGSLPGLAEPKVTKPVAPSGGVVEHFENYMLEAEVKQLRKTIASNEKKVKEYDRLKQEYEKLRNAYMTERENRKKLQGSIESSVRTPLTDSSNKDLPSTVSSQKKSDITSGSCYPHSGTKNSLSSQEPFTGSKVSTGGSSCSTVGSKNTSSESFIDSGVSGSRYLSGSSVDKLHRSSVDQTQSSSHSGKGSSISAGNNSFRFDGSLSSIYTTDKEATGETSLWHKKPTVPPKLAMSVSKKTEKPKPGQDDNCITQ